MTTPSWRNEFQQPSAEMRAKPFWAWNGKLEAEELRRQIRLMHQAGLGGFFMHSRVGLDTVYLSPEWHDCTRACIEEAEKLGMEAWLYDEDRWPSGAAGGLVTKNPAYRMRSLMLARFASPAEFARSAETVAVFIGRVVGDQVSGLRPVAENECVPALATGEEILHFYVQISETSPWYNDATYLDTLSHDAVKEFIRVTHEAYREKFGAEFGKRVPGIFTDEPNYGFTLSSDGNTGLPSGIPWTGALPETFKQRYGYDLLPRLPELFFDVDGQAVSQARYHYHDCTTHLFVDAFGRQVFDWCEKNQMTFTGHVLEEDTLSRQTNVVGSAMRFYEYMQAPGMDLLTEHGLVFDTAKQVSSAAHQFGRTWRLTETYGCTGWDFPLAGHKALGDWQMALGINLRCQHLSWYTMQAEAKRDYPAAVFYQSPWWGQYGTVEDYFARINAVMTRGTEQRDLLVIHPVESAWLLCKTGWRTGWQMNPASVEFDFKLSRLSHTLLANHLDFDYGDEELLSRHARVVTGAAGAELHVGQAVYKSVLVPSQITMRRSTLELLKKFRAHGGSVTFAGDVATYVDALPSTAVTAFAQAGNCLPASGEKLICGLEKSCRRLHITDAAGNELTSVLYLLREDAENSYLFLCNLGMEFTNGEIDTAPLVRDRVLTHPDVRIRGFRNHAGQPLELHPATGAEFASLATGDAVSGWELRTSLPTIGSRLFVIPKRAGSAAPVAAPEMKVVGQESLGETWRCRLSEANVLVLDRCRFKIGAGEWQNADEILRVDCAIRDALGIQHRGGQMVQPWARPVPAAPRVLPVVLEYAFNITELPSGALSLALETPEQFRVTLNGAMVNVDNECGWWTDRSLRTVPLDPFQLRIGRNELRLELAYAETFSGLEIIYLLGTFGVKIEALELTMTAPVSELRVGDWCDQGLPFYAGHVAYCRPIQPTLAPHEQLLVRVPDHRGTGIRVLVDGAEAGVALWPPYEVDITALVASGQTAELVIELLGHRRNSHGPFHLNTKWPQWTGPNEFQAGPDRWFDGWQLVPCGLLAPPELLTCR